MGKTDDTAKPDNDAVDDVVEEVEVDDDQLPEDKQVVDDKDADDEDADKTDDSEDADDDKDSDDKDDDSDKDDSDDSDDDADYELELPEGSLMDASQLDETLTYAKEEGLSKEATQELLERENKAVTRYAESKLDEVKVIRKDWLKEIKADKDLGGKNLTKTQAMAKRVLDTFGSKELKKAFDNTGFGDHPEWVRFVNAIGKSMSDDQFVHASASGGKKQSTAKRMFKGLENE